MFGLKTRFACSGVLHYGETRKSFKVATAHVHTLLGRNCECLLRMELEETHPLEFFMHLMNNSGDHQPTFSGVLDDGRPLVATGLSLHDYSSATFSVGELIIGDIRPCQDVRLFFPNLRVARRQDLIQDEDQYRLVSRPWRFPLPLPLDMYNAQLTIRKDIQDIKVDRHNPNQYRLTAVLDIVSDHLPVDWVGVETAIYRLCDLLTLASGRKVSWLIAHGTDSSRSLDWWVYRRHTVSKWEGKGAIIPIHRHANLFWKLLECWPVVLRFNEGQVLAIQRSLHLHLHSGPTYAFPVPLYCTAGAFEILYKAFFDHGRSMKYVPGERDSKRLCKSFRNWAKENFEPCIADESLREEFRKSLTGKWGLINNRSLKGRIITMAKELRLRFDEAEVKEFVELRNDAVHAISLDYKDPYGLFRALRPMEDLLVRIMLRLIGYQGEYQGYHRGVETLLEVE